MSASPTDPASGRPSALLAHGDLATIPGGELRSVRCDDGETVTVSAGLGLPGTIDFLRSEIVAVQRFAYWHPETNSPVYGPREAFRP